MFHSSLKAPIHEATLLPATVACNNVAACICVDVAACVMQCCVVACCRQLLLKFRLQFYFQVTVAGNKVASCMGALKIFPSLSSCTHVHVHVHLCILPIV